MGRTVIVATPGATTERATLTWGAQCEARIDPKRSGVNVVCCKRQSEQERAKYEPVSVVAPPDGPSAGQRVDFERANVVTLKTKHKNNCLSDWHYESGVAFGVTEALAEFSSDMSFSKENDPDETCQTEWHLTNTPTGK